MPTFRLLDISHTKYLSDLILGLHKACLVLVRRFPSPSRSIPFGVVTLTLWPRGIRRPRDLANSWRGSVNFQILNVMFFEWIRFFGDSVTVKLESSPFYSYKCWSSPCFDITLLPLLS